MTALDTDPIKANVTNVREGKTLFTSLDMTIIVCIGSDSIAIGRCHALITLGLLNNMSVISCLNFQISLENFLKKLKISMF